MNNTYGTHVLLEACRMSGQIRRFINVSTDEVYGKSSLGREKGALPPMNLRTQEHGKRALLRTWQLHCCPYVPL